MTKAEAKVINATLAKLKAAQDDLRAEYTSDANTDPWIIGYSGGKDSSLLTQLVFEMLLDLAPGDRNRPVHVLCNDTLVESPILMAYIDKMLGRLEAAADSLHLPIKVVKTTPDPDQTFWVNLIGRGYPAPTRMFRWCTDRMKIAPTSEYTLVVSPPGRQRNTDLFVAHLDEPRTRFRRARKVHVICDNAPFHCSRRVQDYLHRWNHRLAVHYLPKYAPETNPIERVWWRLHETLTRNHRCPTIDHLVTDVYDWIESRRCFYDRDLANYLTAA